MGGEVWGGLPLPTRRGGSAPVPRKIEFFTWNGVFRCILSGIFIRVIAIKMLIFSARSNDLVDVKDVLLGSSEYAVRVLGLVSFLLYWNASNLLLEILKHEKSVGQFGLAAHGKFWGTRPLSPWFALVLLTDIIGVLMHLNGAGFTIAGALFDTNLDPWLPLTPFVFLLVKNCVSECGPLNSCMEGGGAPSGWTVWTFLNPALTLTLSGSRSKVTGQRLKVYVYRSILCQVGWDVKP